MPKSVMIVKVSSRRGAENTIVVFAVKFFVLVALRTSSKGPGLVKTAWFAFVTYAWRSLKKGVLTMTMTTTTAP
jgi:hypothetical protein